MPKPIETVDVAIWHGGYFHGLHIAISGRLMWYKAWLTRASASPDDRRPTRPGANKGPVFGLPSPVTFTLINKSKFY
ncbi:MAG: hypothetical protein U0401_34150 [Anaerolineae bacterium]